MSVKYRRDPIIEALCEFRFSSDTPWDVVLPGIMYRGAISEEFPTREIRKQHTLQLDGDPKESGFRQRVETTERVLFWNRGKDRLIQVGDRLLALNVLKPYSGWEEFRALIDKGLTASKEATEIKGVDRILLQYINRIEIPEPKVDLENYFEFRPHHGETLPGDFHNFSLVTDFTMEGGADCCRIDLRGAAPSEKGHSGFLLTLAYFTAQPKAIEVRDWKTWTETAHKRVKEAFEGALTKRTKELLEPEECHE